MDLVVEVVQEVNDLRTLGSIFEATWGDEVGQLLPAMIVQAKFGGVCLLGRLDGVPVGASYAFPARLAGEVVLWSHATAVLTKDQGVGSALKTFQLERARKLGYSDIAWTFDPMIGRNAYFNLVKLGAQVVDFVEDLYGVEGPNSSKVMLPSDRLIVKTDLNAIAKPIALFDRIDPIWRDAGLAKGEAAPDGGWITPGLYYLEITSTQEKVAVGELPVALRPALTLGELLRSGGVVVGVFLRAKALTGYVVEIPLGGERC